MEALSSDVETRKALAADVAVRGILGTVGLDRGRRRSLSSK